MRNLFPQNTPHMLAAIIGCVTLSACGGGGPDASAEAGQDIVTTAARVQSGKVDSNNGKSGSRGDKQPLTPTAPAVEPTPTPEPTPAPTPAPTPTDIVPGAQITDIRFENTGTAQSGVPITFGHAFAVGAVLAGESVVGKLPDGTLVPLQVDIKAKYPDGSVRHAVISAVLPTLATAEIKTMALVKAAPYAGATSATPAALLSAGFTAATSITLAGQQYTASADALLKSGKFTSWLTGAIANEWHVSAPLTTAAGVAHPHLTARFAIRSYTGSKKARVDVTIENNWAYAVAPQNFVYDAQISVGGQTVYTKAGLTHYHHARWRKIFWWGGEPAVHIKHNTAYLLNSKAVPNYDRTVIVTETALAKLKTAWIGTKTEPMGVGEANPAMPATGGRPDIGLLPGWSAMYLLSMDKRAKEVMLGTADLAGSWSSHYRNQTTDRPVSLVDYPYMTILGNATDTKNPATGQYEAFPACATTTACTTPNKHDSAHQPAFAYLPYLVTGDYYYLEELQFWSMWNTFASNPGYRQNVKGLLASNQVRAQAWSLRSLAEAAYISPDSDPLTTHLKYYLASNIDWYNATYANNATANALGAITHSGAVIYKSSTAVSPWQDDFFTAAVGRTVELGFDQAKPLLTWKAKFPIARMIDPEGCWILAANYTITVRDTATSPLYSSYGQAYRGSYVPELSGLKCNSLEMAAYLQLKVGQMEGYADSVVGYPANMQPALAYSASVGANGLAAWQAFQARAVKPNYTTGPQFAVVPR